MHCAAWNVNGLRAIAAKGFTEWLAKSPFDVVLLQETKVSADDLPDELGVIGDHHIRLLPAQKKGYSGVAIYCREQPDEWIEGIGDARFDVEGRTLWARYGDVLIGSAYFPNSQAEGARLDYRLAFGARLHEFLAAERARGRHIVIGGDYNVAHRPIDLARPKSNERNPGYLPEERRWMTDFLGAGFVDTWRHQHPTTVGYSWWSYRAGARTKNIGWRLDYLCVDEALLPRVRATDIHPAVLGSDHCPISLLFDVP